MSSSTAIHAPVPNRPRLITSLSSESFSDDLANAFAHSNTYPRVPEQNIKSLQATAVPHPPPPSPIDPSLLQSAGSSSASLNMVVGKVNGR